MSYVDDLFQRAESLLVQSILVTYHPGEGAVVVCAWGEPAIDMGYADGSQYVARATSLEVAAKRVLSKLSGPARLRRIEADGALDGEQ